MTKDDILNLKIGDLMALMNSRDEEDRLLAAKPLACFPTRLEKLRHAVACAYKVSERFDALVDAAREAQKLNEPVTVSTWPPADPPQCESLKPAPTTKRCVLSKGHAGPHQCGDDLWKDPERCPSLYAWLSPSGPTTVQCEQLKGHTRWHDALSITDTGNIRHRWQDGAAVREPQPVPAGGKAALSTCQEHPPSAAADLPPGLLEKLRLYQSSESPAIAAGIIEKLVARIDQVNVQRDELWAERKQLRLDVAQLRNDVAVAKGHQEKAERWAELCTRGKSPCGHWKAYAVTEDGGKLITCLECRAVAAEQALAEVPSDPVPVCPTCSGLKTVPRPGRPFGSTETVPCACQPVPAGGKCPSRWRDRSCALPAGHADLHTSAANRPDGWADVSPGRCTAETIDARGIPVRCTYRVAPGWYHYSHQGTDSTGALIGWRDVPAGGKRGPVPLPFGMSDVERRGLTDPVVQRGLALERTHNWTTLGTLCTLVLALSDALKASQDAHAATLAGASVEPSLCRCGHSFRRHTTNSGVLTDCASCSCMTYKPAHVDRPGWSTLGVATPDAPVAVDEETVTCERCQMKLPRRLTDMTVGPRGPGWKPICAACNTGILKDDPRRLEVVALHRLARSTPHPTPSAPREPDVPAPPASDSIQTSSASSHAGDAQPCCTGINGSHTQACEVIGKHVAFLICWCCLGFFPRGWACLWSDKGSRCFRCEGHAQPCRTRPGEGIPAVRVDVRKLAGEGD